jgi:hypothetical protein
MRHIKLFLVVPFSPACNHYQYDDPATGNSRTQDLYPRVPAHDAHGCLLRSSHLAVIATSSEAFRSLSRGRLYFRSVSMSSPALWEDVIQPGSSWSLILRRGREMRIEDPDGGANVAAVFFNFDCPVERYNMPDTLKAQHTAHLTKGFVLYSDMGRVLCSITDDRCGWHDPLGGHNDAAAVRAKYGSSGYQQERNAWHQNTRGNFLTELSRYGLGIRDLPANVNFFSKVVVGESGAMEFVPRNSRAGDYVTLRAEMNVLVVLDTGQHPLDPNPLYDPKPVKIAIRQAAEAGADDLCHLSRPENARGFINTERYFL